MKHGIHIILIPVSVYIGLIIIFLLNGKNINVYLHKVHLIIKSFNYSTIHILHLLYMNKLAQRILQTIIIYGKNENYLPVIYYFHK